MHLAYKKITSASLKNKKRGGNEMRRCIRTGLFSLFIWMFLFVQVADASELNFSASAIIPENQIDKKQTYFDLRMEPGQKQTVEVVLTNDTKKEVTVEVFINAAVTNNNGIIDYSQKNYEQDSSLKYNIEDLVTSDKEMTIPAQSSKTLPIHIEMPAEAFDGVILGGIHLQEKEEQTEVKKDVQIANRFAYVIGMMLSTNDNEVKPSLQLNKIKPAQVNYRNVITANLQNTAPTIVKPLSVDAKIYKENGDKVLFATKQENMRMAPNSNFDFAIPLNNQEMKRGTYRLQLEATDGNQKWKWEETFTIDGDVAKDFNKQAVGLQKDDTVRYIVGGTLLGVLLLIFVFWLGRRSKKQPFE